MSEYRSRKLLDLAREVETCHGCGKWAESGSIVAAHSNQLRDGKGRGIKSHDFRVAFLCPHCHHFVDESSASREEKQSFWEEAHRNTIAWLFLSGKVKC